MRTSQEFTEAVDANWDAVYHLAYRLCGSRHDAEDIAQQTFYQAFRAWSGFEGRSSVRTWLIKIAIHASARLLKERDRTPQPLASAKDEPAPGTNAVEDRHAEVRLALMELRPLHRLVLTLFCVDGLTHGEIAEILECPEGTVWSRLHHAKKALAAKLERKEHVR